MHVLETTPGGTTDGEVIAASGVDPQRFGQVFDRHVDAIYGYLCRRVGRTSAEELTSETFARAFDGRQGFTGEDALPWLFGIASNLIRHHARAERRQLAAFARVASRDARDQVDDDVEGRMDAAAMAPALAEALRRLRPDERDVLLMHAWQGLSYRDIADAQGIAVGTVGSRLTRARATVREVLRECEQLGEGGSDG
ncbi:MAG: RNA polymerase sigma factor [Actinomycetota bacterium]